jgi:hypothetical protein
LALVEAAGVAVAAEAAADVAALPPSAAVPDSAPGEAAGWLCACESLDELVLSAPVVCAPSAAEPASELGAGAGAGSGCDGAAGALAAD